MDLVIPVSHTKKRKIEDWDGVCKRSCKTRIASYTVLHDKCAAVVIREYRRQTLAPPHTNKLWKQKGWAGM